MAKPTSESYMSVPAAPDDYTPVVAELIRSTAPAIWDWVFNNDQDALVECMEAWWKAGDAVWSHRNAYLVRGDGQPIALLLSFSHKEYVTAIGPTVAIANKILTREAFDHMMRAFGWFRAIIIEIPDDASYESASSRTSAPGQGNRRQTAPRGVVARPIARAQGSRAGCQRG